jgi:hypothetical protein
MAVSIVEIFNNVENSGLGEQWPYIRAFDWLGQRFSLSREEKWRIGLICRFEEVSDVESGPGKPQSFAELLGVSVRTSIGRRALV